MGDWCVCPAAVLDKAEVVGEERSGNHLFVVVSSDRGLCGSVHSNLARTIRPLMEERGSSDNTYFVCIGDKVRSVAHWWVMVSASPSLDPHNLTAKLQKQAVPDIQ